MRIFLIRHGEATDVVKDPKRPLTQTGCAQIQNMADYLQIEHAQIKQIFHSGKERSKQTAEIICQTIAPEAPVGVLEELDPDADPKDLMPLIEAFGDGTLYSGHLPYLQNIVENLLNEEADEIVFNPGSLVILETQDGKTWKLIRCVHPEV